MSMKSMTMIPPMSRSRSCRTTSSAASTLTLVIVSSSAALAAAGEAAGVDVDHGQRLGVVDHQVAARRPGRPAASSTWSNASSTPSRSSSGSRALVELDELDQLRRRALEEAGHALVLLLVVDDRAVELLRRARRAGRGSRGRPPGRPASGALTSFGAPLHHLVELAQVVEVALEVAPCARPGPRCGRSRRPSPSCWIFCSSLR